ncbi:MAG: hypothetical protein KQI35_14450 [Bacteroidetes bacterium]|nr:hypothetical protein [Bacteroidota bacterium]
MQTKKVIFKEEQHYRPMRVRLVLPLVMAAIFILYATGILQEYRKAGESVNSMLPIILIGAALMVLLILVMITLYRMKLITTIVEDGIYLRYPPLLTRERMIPASSIQHYEAREYRPRFEYGGHGYRVRGRLLRKRKYGIAFTASGKSGIQLILHDGRKILIGTQRETAFLHAMDKIVEQKENI